MTTPTQQVSEWLAAFGAALDRADYDSAIDMFGDDSHWRELAVHRKSLLRCRRVSFTRNRKTLSGKRSIRAMLEATVSAAKPGRWQTDGEATEADGITEAWFTFETIVSVGSGHIRLEAGKCWIISTITSTDGACC